MSEQTDEILPIQSESLTQSSPQELGPLAVYQLQETGSTPDHFKLPVTRQPTRKNRDLYSLVPIKNKTEKPRVNLKRRKFVKGSLLLTGAALLTKYGKPLEALSQRVKPAVGSAVVELVKAADEKLPEAAATLFDNETLLDQAIEITEHAAKAVYDKKYEDNPLMMEENPDYKPLLDIIKESVEVARQKNPELNLFFKPNQEDIEASSMIRFARLLSDLEDEGFTTSSIIKNMIEETPEFEERRNDYITKMEQKIVEYPGLSKQAKLALQAAFNNFNDGQDILRLFWSNSDLVDKDRLDQPITKHKIHRVIMDIYEKWENSNESFTASDILSERIIDNNGDIAASIDDTALILKILSRNLVKENYYFLDYSPQHASLQLRNFTSHFSDEYSYKSPGWGRSNAKSLDPAIVYKDPNMQTANRIGQPYHIFNILSLANHIDRRLVKAIAVAEQAAWLTQQGELKYSADMEALKQIDAIHDYLYLSTVSN